MHIERNKLESPIEEIFIQQFEKFTSESCELIPQYEISTTNGNFRIDFVIISNNFKIGIELDGKQFHDEWRDEWRDSIILGNKKLDIIYRLRGKDITSYINECIFLIYKFDKRIFSNRYVEVHKSLIDAEYFDNSDVIFMHNEETYACSVEITDNYGEKTGYHHNIRITRRNRENKKQYWNKLFEFSKIHSKLNIDELISLRKIENNSGCR